MLVSGTKWWFDISTHFQMALHHFLTWSKIMLFPASELLRSTTLRAHFSEWLQEWVSECVCVCVHVWPLWEQMYRSWEGIFDVGSQKPRTLRLKRGKKGSDMTESPSNGTLLQPFPGAASTQVVACAVGWTGACLKHLPTSVQNIYNSHECFKISLQQFLFRRGSLQVGDH